MSGMQWKWSSLCVESVVLLRDNCKALSSSVSAYLCLVFDTQKSFESLFYLEVHQQEFLTPIVQKPMIL